MKKILLTLHDDTKAAFILELLNQFDFVDVQKTEDVKIDSYDFFVSAGLWKNRNISADQLRRDAWKSPT